MLQISLGIAGTAKNTGKTTATAAIIKELRIRGCAISLTSIGYDGEDLDNITGLPKPKLSVEPGDLIITAERCINACTANVKIIQKTHISTLLGKIVIAEVKSSGLAVIAGPNKISDVRKISTLLRQIRPGVIMIDGALNRIAPMVETDGFILATGAARTTDILRLTRETEAISKICNLPAARGGIEHLSLPSDNIVLLESNLRPIVRWPSSSLIIESDITKLLSTIPSDMSYLYVPGIMSEKALNALRKLYKENSNKLSLVFQDPIKVLLTDEPVLVYEQIDALRDCGITVSVMKRLPLLAITVSPFYPQYRMDIKSYSPAFVDPIALEESIKSRVNIPVYDVLRCGVKELVDFVLNSILPYNESGIEHS